MDSHSCYPSLAVSLYPVRAACPLPSTVLDLNSYASGPHSRSSARVAGTWSLIHRVRCPSVGVKNKWSLVGSKSRRSSVGSMGRLLTLRVVVPQLAIKVNDPQLVLSVNVPWGRGSSVGSKCRGPSAGS